MRLEKAIFFIIHFFFFNFKHISLRPQIISRHLFIHTPILGLISYLVSRRPPASLLTLLLISTQFHLKDSMSVKTYNQKRRDLLHIH